jgi:2-oxoglutarate ferredoxin oxidoreductase subunit beta
MFDDPTLETHFPRPFGVFYENNRPCYEDMLKRQIDETIGAKGKGNLNRLLSGRETWTINA